MPNPTAAGSRNLDEALANRRATFRHKLSAPLRLGSQEGHVRDLSTRGLYFVSRSSPRVGSLIELEVTLPNASPSGPLACRLTARVLRVEDLGPSRGVAAQIEAWTMPDVDGDG
jgi:hypothetical protein